MIIPKQIRKDYEEKVGTLSQIANKLKETLFPYCEEKGFAYKQRIKSVESFYEKLETGRYRNVNDIDDLVAATIIMATLSQENDVLNYLDTVFQIKNVKRRNSTQKSPDVFRFDSTRVIAYFKNPFDSNGAIYKICFEVQLLTSFEHAWQVTTHAISYKSNDIDWKTLRLASQLRASVEQLDVLVDSFSDIKNNVNESGWNYIAFRKRISEFLQEMFDTNEIDDEHIPKDMSRFSDNVLTIFNETIKFGKIRDVAHINELLSEFRHFTASTKIPQSITLLQFILICLIYQGKIKKNDSTYYCIITDELLDIYPDLVDSINNLRKLTL